MLQFRPEPEISFFNINELAGLRRWLEGPFMAVFFGYSPNTAPDDDAWTKMTPLATYIPGFYLASTTVLGPIRLRQLRVGSDSCEVCLSLHNAWCFLKQSTASNRLSPIRRIGACDVMWPLLIVLPGFAGR